MTVAKRGRRCRADFILLFFITIKTAHFAYFDIVLFFKPGIFARNTTLLLLHQVTLLLLFVDDLALSDGGSPIVSILRTARVPCVPTTVIKDHITVADCILFGREIKEGIQLAWSLSYRFLLDGGQREVRYMILARNNGRALLRLGRVSSWLVNVTASKLIGVAVTFKKICSRRPLLWRHIRIMLRLLLLFTIAVVFYEEKIVAEFTCMVVPLRQHGNGVT